MSERALIIQRYWQLRILTGGARKTKAGLRLEYPRIPAAFLQWRYCVFDLCLGQCAKTRQKKSLHMRPLGPNCKCRMLIIMNLDFCIQFMNANEVFSQIVLKKNKELLFSCFICLCCVPKTEMCFQEMQLLFVTAINRSLSNLTDIFRFWKPCPQEPACNLFFGSTYLRCISSRWPLWIAADKIYTWSWSLWWKETGDGYWLYVCSERKMLTIKITSTGPGYGGTVKTDTKTALFLSPFHLS